MLQRFFNKIFSRNYLAAAALYSGLALLLLAAVPDQCLRSFFSTIGAFSG